MASEHDNLVLVFTAWLDALRRGDLDTLGAHLAPDVVWQGLRPDLRCNDREEVVATVAAQLDLPAVEALELRVAGGDQVVLGVVSPDLVEVAGEPLPGQVWEVFTIRDGAILRIDEYKTRPEAVRAAELDDPSLAVADRGTPLSFTFEDLLRHHGPGSPGGVAIAFRALELGLPLLAPDALPERRDITVRTAFGGPGARDAFELVTRAVTDGRYVVDPRLARPERGRALERFVFTLEHWGRTATLLLREGFVDDEFVDLARTPSRDAAQEARLDVLKHRLAARVMAAPADRVLEIEA
jgi:ketosteroid isomerase-like protein